MLQKTFTPQILPLRNIPNRGELDKFYIENTHDAIIYKKDFEVVQALLQSRGDGERKKPTKRILTKKVYCEECGWAYRHRVQNKKDYWVCSRKGNAGYECEGPNLSEKEIYSAFVRMYNKLRYFESEICNRKSYKTKANNHISRTSILSADNGNYSQKQ